MIAESIWATKRMLRPVTKEETESEGVTVNALP